MKKRLAIKYTPINPAVNEVTKSLSKRNLAMKTSIIADLGTTMMDK